MKSNLDHLSNVFLTHGRQFQSSPIGRVNRGIGNTKCACVKSSTWYATLFSNQQSATLWHRARLRSVMYKNMQYYLLCKVLNFCGLRITNFDNLKKTKISRSNCCGGKKHFSTYWQEPCSLHAWKLCTEAKQCNKMDLDQLLKLRYIQFHRFIPFHRGDLVEIHLAAKAILSLINVTSSPLGCKFQKKLMVDFCSSL